MKHKHHSKRNRKNFIILPILFLLLGYLLLYIILSPILAPFTDAMGLVFFKDRPGQSMEIHNIFDNENIQNMGKDTIKASEIEMPQYGTIFGNLTIEGTSVNADLFFGDGNRELKNGVGMYNGSHIPGYGSTCLIGGHNNSYFSDLKNAQLGSKITINTNYGQYVYEITKTEVLMAKDSSAWDPKSETENVVLYTCYPFDMLGLTPQRYFVYGTYVSGPKIEKYE